MKFCTLLAVTLLVTFGASAQAKTEKEDVSLLKPGHISYADAVNAATRFESHGLKINSIHQSKLQGFFRDIWQAAVYKTDEGAFEIIFFPEPGQAEKIRVKEERDGKRYIYSFEGQPRPNPPADVFNAAYPMRFIMTDNLFVVVFNNEELYQILNEILKQ